MNALFRAQPTGNGVETSFARRRPGIWRALVALGVIAIFTSAAARLAPWLKERQLARLDLPALVRRAEAAPGDPATLYYYGEALLATGAAPQASEVFRRAVEADPTAARAYTGLARSQVALGRAGAAETIFRQALRLAPQEPEAHYSLAKLYLDHGRFVDAVPELEAATRIRPRDPRFWYVLGQAYARAFKRDESLGALERAVELDERQADYWRDLGRAYWDYSRLEDAQLAFERALRLKPDDPVLLIWLGQVFLQKPDTPENRRLAEESFRKSIRLAPDMGEAHLKLGELLHRASRYEEAEAELRRALRLAPNLDQALFHLGQVLVRRGRQAEGARYLEAYEEMVSVQNTVETLKDQIDHEPQRPDLRLKLARIYRKYGNLAGAAEAYGAYLSQRPTDVAVQRELRKLQKESAGEVSPASQSPSPSKFRSSPSP